MEANIIAIGMILTIALTALTLIGSKREKLSWPALLWLLLWGAFCFILFPSTIVMHSYGNTLFILLITSFCAAISLAVIITPIWRYLALIGFTIAMSVGLTNYTGDLISSGRYTSSSRPCVRERESLYNRLRYVEQDTRSYPPGWLSTQPFAAHIPAELTRNNRRIPHDAWHTPFTGLRAVELQPVEAWYTGGKIKDAKIEYRVRTGK